VPYANFSEGCILVAYHQLFEGDQLTMNACDFSRSFITFVIPKQANNARIQVEACCEITAAGRTEPFWLVASCKAENTYAEQELFMQPNYDFYMIYSQQGYRINRVGMPYDLSAGEVGLISERFEAVHFGIRSVDAQRCESPADVVDATLQGRVLVGQTTLSSSDGEFTAVLQYPVKTMNVHRDPADFQVDTGPVLLPDMDSASTALEAFSVAFIAWRAPDWAEFILQQPVPATEDGPMVAHYAQTRVFEAQNLILAHD